MIGTILPAPVASRESFHDPDEATLFPDEEAVVARAVPKRRHEFTTVRWCARAALARLDIAAAAILPGERGQPQWPAGVVGSMTHCAGYRAAAVARATDMATVGIDAEPHERLPPDILDAVASPAEQRHLHELAHAFPAVWWDRLLFSAKESVYKAWFPLARRWLNFHDAVITFDHTDGTFDARLLVPGPLLDGRALTGFAGRWLVRDGILLSAIAVPNSTTPASTAPDAG